MNTNYTHIAVIIDRSGSMADIATDVIGGFNQFLSDQRNVKTNHATLSLVQFDTMNPFEVIHDFRTLPAIEPLNANTYQPRGGTPLLDAVGHGIKSLDERLTQMREHEKPGQILFRIITDGEENASRQYSHRAIRDLIAARTEQGWQFVYLSADLDAFADSDRIGIAESHKMAFDKTGRGTRDAFADVSFNISETRYGRKSRAQAFFEESQRAKYDLEQRRRGDDSNSGN